MEDTTTTRTFQIIHNNDTVNYKVDKKFIEYFM